MSICAPETWLSKATPATMRPMISVISHILQGAVMGRAARLSLMLVSWLFANAGH